MKSSKFNLIISALTGRDLTIHPHNSLPSFVSRDSVESTEITPENRYDIFKWVTLDGIPTYATSFEFKTPKNEENLVKSFVSQFIAKFHEPDPSRYKDWNTRTPEKRLYAHRHHPGFMLSKGQLSAQVAAISTKNEAQRVFMRHGFYPTNYGIGIFVVCFAPAFTAKAIDAMADFLTSEGVPFTNEFSNARWVYRFCIGNDKPHHTTLLSSFISRQ